MSTHIEINICVWFVDFVKIDADFKYGNKGKTITKSHKYTDFCNFVVIAFA